MKSVPNFNHWNISPVSLIGILLNQEVFLLQTVYHKLISPTLYSNKMKKKGQFSLPEQPEFNMCMFSL